MSNAPIATTTSGTPSRWDPAQYERFKAERSRPFFDLLALVRPRPGMRIVDLGCGTGEPTRDLHATLGARETLGIDSSETMLAKAVGFAKEGLRFELGQIESWSPSGMSTAARQGSPSTAPRQGSQIDLVFSNAALHWVDGHEALFKRMRGALETGGQIAIQMPANDDHPSHATAAAVAAEAPFRDELEGFVRRSSVLPVERYAELLHELGFGEMNVKMQVYGHRLPTREDVIEWVKGTLLTDYAKRLSAESYERFLARYREALFERLPDERPFFYTYKRLLIWGEVGEAAP